jgi:mono/diheme cytochrome c family protein
LEIKLGNLDFSENEWGLLQEYWQSPEKHSEAIEGLKTFYAQKSPATFVEVPQDKSVGYGIKGDQERGMAIYELSCQHCHHPNGESLFELDDSKATFKKLNRNITNSSRFSIYEIIRHGTYPSPGHKPYMPHYTLERMSHQQVEDLRAYIKEMVE